MMLVILWLPLGVPASVSRPASSRAGFRSSDPFTPPFLTFHNFLFYVSKNFPNIVPIMKLVKDIVTTRLRDIDPTKA
ncbi:MAG: hypothetical protein RIB86_11300 [Imperialibacter sp.]|uniref:hypothetical protein n=1 Tax=Imperialibacter sp. TaxID=2038411 RepID=UPI0032EFB32A